MITAFGLATVASLFFIVGLSVEHCRREADPGSRVFFEVAASIGANAFWFSASGLSLWRRSDEAQKAAQ
jgi:hypothetical protein